MTSPASYFGVMHFICGSNIDFMLIYKCLCKLLVQNATPYILHHLLACALNKSLIGLDTFSDMEVTFLVMYIFIMLFFTDILHCLLFMLLDSCRSLILCAETAQKGWIPSIHVNCLYSQDYENMSKYGWIICFDIF